MPAATHALLNRFYAACNAGDIAAVLDLLAADVVHDINQGGRESGRMAFGSFLQRSGRCYRERIDVLEIMTNADGSRAAVEYRVDGEYLATDIGLPPAAGQRYRLSGGAFFEIRRGRITRITDYYSLSDWLAQLVA